MAGSTRLSASGEVGGAGKPIRIFNVHIISTSGGASVVSFKNNGTGGTVYLTETGITTTGKTFDYGIYGHLFPNGCYVTFDGNTSSVLVGNESA